MNESAKRVFSVVILAGALATNAFAAGQNGSTDVKVIASSNGKYELAVTPIQSDGIGSATYILRHKGKTVWRGARPFYLRAAVLGNTGAVIGYSLPAGLQGQETESAKDQLLIWHVNPDGKAAQLTSYDRHTSLTDPTPMPVCTGVMSYDADGIALVAIRGLPASDLKTSGTTFLLFDIVTGKPKGDWKAARPGRDWRLLDFAPIQGTRNTVLGWETDRGDLALTMANANGIYTWWKQFPKVRLNATTALRAQPLFAKHAQVNRFVVFINDRQIEYVINQKSGAVVGTMSGPYDSLASEKQLYQAIPQSKLVFAKSVLLRPTKTEPAATVRDVKRFIDAGKNRFAYIDNWAGSAGHFVIVDTAGTLLGRFNLSQLVAEDYPTWSDYVWLDEKSFLIALKQRDKPASLWKINLETDDLQRMKLGDYDWLTPKFARLSDGNLAVTETTPERAESAHLAVFTPNGHLATTCELPRDLSSGYRPSGIAAIGKGVICVLDSTNKTVYTFSRNGRYLSRIKLIDRDQRQIEYPTDIAGTKDGFVVQGQPSADSKRGSTMYFYNLAGTLSRSIQPHRAKGGLITTSNAVRFDASGNLWASNQHALVRLDSDGAVAEVLGPKYDVDALSEVRNLMVTPSDYMYILDGRTMSLHSFSANGDQRYVFHPTRADFPNGAVSDLSMSRDGHVFLGSSNKGDVILDGSGRLIGYWGPPAKPGSSRKTFDASVGKRWTFDTTDSSAKLTDINGNAVRVIDKRRDGAAIGKVIDLKAALNGSACIASRAEDSEGSTRLRLNFFDSQGNATSAFMVPKWPNARLYSFDGNQVILQGNHVLIAYTTRGDGIWRASIGSIPDHGMHTVSRDGRYFIYADPKRVNYFLLPGTDLYPRAKTPARSKAPTTPPRRGGKGPVSAIGIG